MPALAALHPRAPQVVSRSSVAEEGKLRLPRATWFLLCRMRSLGRS